MGFLEERDLSNVPTITEYYRGKTIFVTGGSGFMGQTLIEKLLYSCSDLDRIYLLMRPKKGVKSEDRLAALYTSACFDRLKKEKPDIFASKVFVIAGDASDIGLGLSDEDRTLLINRVNIIFHVAASVRFDDTLQYAAKLNLRGTCEVIELAKEVRDLSAIIHVSTCYANTKYAHSEEILYEPLADWRSTLEVCETMDGHTLKVFTNKFIAGMPNTYVFTKQLGEHVAYEQKGKLPMVIIRPSIVISSIEEPIPGWINNFNGPAGIIAACAKGIMRSIFSDPDLVIDFIPVDTCIRHFVAAAWIRGTKKLEPTDDVAIYNCSANDLLQITMGEVCTIGKMVGENYPTEKMLWHPSYDQTTSWTYHYIRVMLYQVLPAVFVDMVLWLLGKNTFLVKIQRRIYQANIALAYYTVRQWKFDNKNFVSLRSKIKEEDKKQFYYEIEHIDKNKFYVDCSLGGRVILLKESCDIPKAKANAFRMWLLDRVVRGILFGLILWKILNTNYVQNFIHSFTQ